jgi:hypothetical protein
VAEKVWLCFPMAVMGGVGAVFQASHQKFELFLKTLGRRRRVRLLGLYLSWRWCVRRLPSLSRVQGSNAVLRMLGQSR